MRKTILYVIDDLGRGGAESLLVGILPELNHAYDIILVTLSDNCEFSREEIQCKYRYSLGFRGKLSFLSCIVKLRKIIKRHRPQLVHTHLVNSSIIARLATPPSIPVACSLHSLLSRNVYDGSIIYRTLERIIFKKEHIVFAVSGEVLEDYQNAIAKPIHGFVLSNYIADVFTRSSPVNKESNSGDGVRAVAVGNIKKVKNYEYLIDAFSMLKDLPVTLDIYGKGDESYVQQLQQAIDIHGPRISFKGQAENIASVLPAYDLYIMSSLHEGFGIAAVEAMAMGLPALLSDIPVLREVTRDNGLFFNLEEPASLAGILKNILEGKLDTRSISARGIEVAREYSREKYVKKLFSIYDNLVFNYA